jgi:TatD DNase family protein
MMQLFDTHAHLALFEDKIEPVLERARNGHVTRILDVATDHASLKKGRDLKKKTLSPELFLAAATTPHDAQSKEDPFFTEVKEAAQAKELVAIGECGLEYLRAPATKEQQQIVFLRYATLAIEEHLPLIVHCREAFPDLLALLDEMPSELRGVVHCFTGAYSDAKALLDKGWFLSFTGIITYPQSGELRDVVKKVALDRIFAETDAPFLAPQSVRGKQNEPGFLPEIVTMIASLKGISFDEAARATFQNAASFFKINL